MKTSEGINDVAAFLHSARGGGSARRRFDLPHRSSNGERHFPVRGRARASGTTSSTAASACSSTTWTTATSSSDGSRHSRGAAGQDPENVKGVAASAKTGRLYVSTIKRVAAIDLAHRTRCSGTRNTKGGADRLAISPDGKIALRAVARGSALERRRRGDRRRRSPRS